MSRETAGHFLYTSHFNLLLLNNPFTSLIFVPMLMNAEHTDWYEHWFGSLYYKILYQSRDELEAQEFIENLLHHLQPLPGSSMLDIACGEGRFAIQLEEHGLMLPVSTCRI